MSSSDHLELSGVIRGVHRRLRLLFASTAGDGHDTEEDLWAEHCRQEDELNRYACAMRQLANTHWKWNNKETRIDWCYDRILDYFQTQSEEASLGRRLFPARLPGKIRLLDVGSCYNPFAMYEDDLDVLAIDICPASQSVRKCDFLNVDIVEEELDCKELPVTIASLPAGYFHVVVFCLLLEYLPLTQFRLRCCVKARRLLCDHGLLLIVTPDSKHQSRNASMMKSWKAAMQCLGFVRIHYEKQTHLHCMAFRKRLGTTTWCDSDVAELLYIPQDAWRPASPSLEEGHVRSAEEDASVTKIFEQLPDFACCQ